MIVCYLWPEADKSIDTTLTLDLTSLTCQLCPICKHPKYLCAFRLVSKIRWQKSALFTRSASKNEFNKAKNPIQSLNIGLWIVPWSPCLDPKKENVGTPTKKSFGIEFQLRQKDLAALDIAPRGRPCPLTCRNNCLMDAVQLHQMMILRKNVH